MKLRKSVSLVLTAIMVVCTVPSAMAGEYVVQKGDTLSKIAPKYNTDWQTLSKTNNLANPHLIYPNQVLEVPDVKKAEETKPAEVVKPKDPVIVEKTDVDAKLSQFVVTSMDGNTITPAFSPDVKAYTLNVQSDVYGVLVDIKASDSAKMTVMASITPGAYGEVDKNETLTVEAGKGGYVIPLTQTYEGYNSEFVQVVTIDVINGEEKETYTLTITRDNDTDAYNLFKQEKFTAKDGTEIAYNIYVPTNYNSENNYPVVFALHGSGQKSQPTDMILKRYQMATTWAKDSEEGTRECIVIAPQALENWYKTEDADTSTPNGKLSAEGQAAYELLHEMMGKYSVDEDRIYMTGLSMGGIGTLTMAYNYPDEFAAIMPMCGRFNNGDAIDYSVFKPLSGNIYYVHAASDPVVAIEDGQNIMNIFKVAGIDFNSKIYSEDTFFYPSAHFSWTPAYADESIREWMFAQSK